MMWSILFIYASLMLSGVSSNTRRLDLMQSRLNILEMRVNIESQQTVSELDLLETSVAALNLSVSQIQDSVCSGEDLDESRSNRGTHAMEDFASDGKRVLKGFMEQKVWTHEHIGEKVTRIDQFDKDRLQLKEKITKKINEQFENLELKTNKLEQHDDSRRVQVESLQEDVRKLQTKEVQLTNKNDDVQENINALQSSVTILTQENEALGASLIEKADIIENIMLEINQLKIDMSKSELVNKILTCQHNWQRFDLHCYFFVDKTLKYKEAMTFCSKLGAHVVDIHSEEENYFVSQLSGLANTWIGLTDEETEGQWKWDHTGKTATYTNWRPGQPDSWYGNQDCVFMGRVYPEQLWNDIECDDGGIVAVVCKMSVFT